MKPNGKQWLLDKIGSLNMSRRGGKTAPYKPLLLLYALSKFANGQVVLSFDQIDQDLRELFHKFRTGSGKTETSYPFWRLQNDGLWTVRTDGPVRPRKSNSDPPKLELKRQHAKGEFSSKVKDVLLADSTAIREVARVLLDQNFPKALHKDIAKSVGLTLED
jgi:putative restriction endonuclease